MNISRVTTISQTLAIAVFALGYVSPSFADKADNDGNHGPHGGGGTGTVTTFSVAVVGGSGDGNWVVTPDGCEGQTDSQKLTFFFPESDADCLAGDVMTGGVLYYLYGIEVREKKTDVMLFFTNVPIAYPISSDVYNTGRLPATVAELAGSSFEIQVDLTGLNLIKAAQPNRGMTEGPIAVGNIVFTAN